MRDQKNDSPADGDIPDIEAASVDEQVSAGSEKFDAMLKPVVGQQGGELPERIRRYRIVRELGRGSFGRVFLGSDDQLQREVAIKVPVGKFLDDPARSADYLNEARTIAGLDHPNIVPVFDVGSTYDFPCYIVTKYIAGESLAQKMRDNRLSVINSIQLVIPIARALHFAHRNGVVHRDIKPENILVDDAGKPYVVDLGLALTEKLATKVSGVVGTPAYMSPEQARGEGHRVDGRTDVYSLGVVLYELLVGRRPFAAKSTVELLSAIADDEPKPLRQIDDTLPRSLERICLRAISRLARDRYTTALDFATDLEECLAECSASTGNSKSGSTDSGSGEFRHPTMVGLAGVGTSTRKDSTDSKPSIQQTQVVPVVPKGPQSFDGHDSDFFLELLPGPFDRDGLPQSIRFWKSAIEKVDDPFRVGLLFGPSGAGKSSFVQAGLVPVLPSTVNVCYVQATSSGTESNIAGILKKRFPSLNIDQPLARVIADLRLGEIDSGTSRVLIVIDQFEQWLAQHLNQNSLHTHDLVAAIRQCDGDHVQCLVTIRDDFWMAITGFFAHLEIDLVNGFNCRGIERFDLEHAEHVLYLFGVALGKMPRAKEELTASDKKFLSDAVNEFAENGRVACVAIALLAEILKSNEWSGDSIRQIGGIRGLGVAYLERHFRGPDAAPENRVHESAIRNAIQAMLPVDESSIKGPAISNSGVAKATGYEIDSAALETTLRILEKRLVTAVDELDDQAGGERVVKYQLAHDFLVPAIRDWISDSQSQTPSGRAELLLQQRSRNWQVSPENQRLPSPSEFAQIAWHCHRKPKSAQQNKMMSSAWKYYLFRVGTVAALTIALASIAGWIVSKMNRQHRITQTVTIIESLNSAPTNAVPFALQNLDEYRKESLGLLTSQFNSGTPHEKLRAAIALASLGDVRTVFLVERFEEGDRSQAQLIVDLLNTTGARADAIQVVESRIEEATGVRRRVKLTWLLADLTNIDAIVETMRIMPDSTARSSAIADMNLWQHNWNEIAEKMRNSEDVQLVSSLLQGLSGVDKHRLGKSVFTRIVNQAKDCYLNHPDALIHASSKSLLNRWQVSLPVVPINKVVPQQKWRVTPNDLTMVYVPAGSFNRAFLANGAKPVKVETSFWMSDMEVSADLFLRFFNDASVKQFDRPFDWETLGEEIFQTETFLRKYENLYTTNHPIKFVSFQDAILFCNWLSRKEGLQPCYERTGKKFRPEQPLTEDETIDAWHIDLKANGYRLPGLFEFEYARNANSDQLFPFGDDLTLARHFCVLSPSGANTRFAECFIGGSRLPNHFGLFDTCGNLDEFCHAVKLGTDEIVPEIDSEFLVTYGYNSWSTTELNYEINRLPGYSSIQMRFSNKGFRVIRRADLMNEKVDEN